MGYLLQVIVRHCRSKNPVKSSWSLAVVRGTSLLDFSNVTKGCPRGRTLVESLIQVSRVHVEDLKMRCEYGISNLKELRGTSRTSTRSIRSVNMPCMPPKDSYVLGVVDSIKEPASKYQPKIPCLRESIPPRLCQFQDLV
jgi:hypothetical protein